jgi:hypothetical protein
MGFEPELELAPELEPGTHVTVSVSVVVTGLLVPPVDVVDVAVAVKENPPLPVGVQLTEVPSSVIVPSHEKVAVPPSSPVLRVHESPSAAGSVMVEEPSDWPLTVALHVYVCPQYEQPPPPPPPLLPPGGVPGGSYGFVGCSCPPDGSYGVVGFS